MLILTFARQKYEMKRVSNIIEFDKVISKTIKDDGGSNLNSN